MPEDKIGENKNRERAFKALAIVGFTAVIALCIFAAVKLVQITPNILSFLPSFDRGEETTVVDEGEDDPTSVTIISDPVDTSNDRPGRVSGESTDRPATTTPRTPTEQPTPRPQPQPETYTHNYTYIPQSDPNGVTDLAARVFAVGYVRGNTLVPSNSIDTSDTAAIQIEVLNIGTKTSERFDVDMQLPNGDDFVLDNQVGLKPNEKVIISISFDPKDLSGTEYFSGDVSVSGDRNNANNRFSGNMRFED